jgi:biotin-dependent carboxylase-like uncharacterized protein
MSIRVVRPGLLTSVQDLGRQGYTHLGISPGGAADSVSFRLANMLVGNDTNAAALEMTLIGGDFVFDTPAVVAITGADASFQCGRKIPMWERMELPAGAEISCGPLANGVRSYLAVHGGIRVKTELGSSSTDFSGRFGGYEGRALRVGDVLRLDTKQRGSDVGPIRRETLPLLRGTGPIRITRGLQWDWFSEGVRSNFLSSGFKVTQQANRSGLRLSGPDVRAIRSGELLTEGVPLGAIQVPQNGRPIILFVDQQTTGGYPKIANLIAADLHRVGQLRPGDDVQFELIEPSEAVRLLRRQEELLQEAIASEG